jgi:hypothetical protein
METGNGMVIQRLDDLYGQYWMSKGQRGHGHRAQKTILAAEVLSRQFLVNRILFSADEVVDVHSLGRSTLKPIQSGRDLIARQGAILGKIAVDERHPLTANFLGCHHVLSGAVKPIDQALIGDRQIRHLRAPYALRAVWKGKNPSCTSQLIYVHNL